MDKRSIENIIRSQRKEFSNYLNQRLNKNVLDFIDMLESYTSLYLFSGIIRDYFVKVTEGFKDFDIEIRDIDLVYDKKNIPIESILQDYEYKKNSFGGYKIRIGDTDIDLWYLYDTWGLKQRNFSIKQSTVADLPKTTFFNFSSIVYSLNEETFIYDKPFLNFIKKKEIDIVLEENPYPELCVINSIYYHQRINYNLSDNLKKYLSKYIKEIQVDKLISVQKKHFKEERISKQEINSFFENTLTSKVYR